MESFRLKRKQLKDYGFVILGSLIMAFGIKNFFAPTGLVTGGFSGLTIVLNALLSVPLWIANALLNIPVFLLSIPLLGWEFTKKSLLSNLSLTLGLALIPQMNLVSEDIFLSCLFGAALSGVGIGMILVKKSTSGGTDTLAALLHLKLRRWSVVELIQYLDGIIILAGISVFGMQKALYAMVALFIATKVSENIVEGVKFSKQLWIISQHTDAIAQRIIVEMDRGVTGVKARGMYSKADKEILFCVVSVKEIVAIKDLVAQVDKDAFVIVSDAREVFGEGFLDKDE